MVSCPGVGIQAGPPEHDRASPIFGLRAPRSGSKSSGWSGSGSAFSARSGWKQIGPARLGLKNIGPGRAARMPTPALNYSSFFKKSSFIVRSILERRLLEKGGARETKAHPTYWGDRYYIYINKRKIIMRLLLI